MAPTIKIRDILNWYWVVAGSLTQVYSSAINDYVPVSNQTYQTWLAAGNIPTAIDTEANLGEALVSLGRPTPAGVLDGYTSAESNKVDAVIGQILFNHENRIRTLAGQPTVTANQFKTFIKGLV